MSVQDVTDIRRMISDNVARMEGIRQAVLNGAVATVPGDLAGMIRDLEIFNDMLAGLTLQQVKASRSILKDWVNRLSLRYQGVLLTAVRGCDSAPKEDVSKDFSRMYRGMILNTHCADPLQALSFIQVYENPQKEVEIFTAFRKDLDHYPHHFVMHVVHAIEIIGYKHPDLETRDRWHSFYRRLCKGLHTNPETEAELSQRLEADEETFGREQKA